MCGIIGVVGHGAATTDILMKGLSRLEYRGYDSAGIALGGESLSVRKREGELDALESALTTDSMTGNLGIGHTRWSTHGPPTDANAHPHTDCSERVAVVHNGIIENYDALKADLQESGHTFKSETDTEVVPHLIERYLDRDYTPDAAVRAAVDHLEGSFALAVVIAGVDAIFAVREDSPLVLGIDEEATFLASDVPAFLPHTDRVVYLENGHVATLRPEGWAVTDRDGTAVTPDIETVEWDAEETGKSGYEHFMLKEIHEQPTAIRQSLSGRVNELEETVELDELEAVARPPAVQFVACGTSYHAALYAAQLFRKAGIPAQAFLAHEYALESPPIGDALVIGVTQSGETADTLAALRDAQDRGAETLAVTNVVGSTATRECDHTMYIRSGPEIGVAATKTFTAQLVSLNVLCEYLRGGSVHDSSSGLLAALRDLPSTLQQVLNDSQAAAVAEAYLDMDGYFFIGRQLDYPVALEGALKFKEISYEHAEGFAAGELKHGTLALVTEETPVIAVVTGASTAARKTLSNVKEVKARGAPVIAVTDNRLEVDPFVDTTLSIPETHPRISPLVANVQLQLFAYRVADALGRSIDKPRHLAKSVTVE